MSEKMTIRDLLQFLLLHFELDEEFYGFELWYLNSDDDVASVDDDDILEWIKGVNDD
jgi:hypothetical protein